MSKPAKFVVFVGRAVQDFTGPLRHKPECHLDSEIVINDVTPRPSKRCVDSEFLDKFAAQRCSWRLSLLHVSSDNVPGIRKVHSRRTPMAEQQLTVTNENRSGDHIPSRRSSLNEIKSVKHDATRVVRAGPHDLRSHAGQP